MFFYSYHKLRRCFVYSVQELFCGSFPLWILPSWYQSEYWHQCLQYLMYVIQHNVYRVFFVLCYLYMIHDMNMYVTGSSRDTSPA